MRLKSVLSSVLLALGTVSAASAAPQATAEQAASIKAALERYVGHGTGEGQGPVSVSPEGDHYNVAIDLKQALHAFETFGYSLGPASYTFTATPLDAGLWHVANAVAPEMTFKHGESSYSVVVNGSAFDGVFDPRVPGFQTSTFSYKSMSVAALAPQGGTQTREIRGGRQTTMATPTGDGTSTVQITQNNDGFSQDIDTGAPQPGAAPSTTKYAIRSASTAGSLAMDDLHSRALADLWAFLVAHASETALKASQDDLRAILRQALPLFDHVNESGQAEQMVVDSPFGSFAAKSIGGQFKMTGLVAQGQVESELHFDGLAIPGGLVPDWADGLVPTSGSVREAFSGFHLDAAARQAIDAFDLSADDPLKPQVLDSMKASLGSLDQMVVTLAPSHLVSKLMTVDFDGEVKLHQPVPDFQVNLRASGLDAAMAELQNKSTGDPTANQVVAVLVLAKGLAKTEPDGKLSWVVTKNGTGQVMVNGLTLPGSQGK